MKDYDEHPLQETPVWVSRLYLLLAMLLLILTLRTCVPGFGTALQAIAQAAGRSRAVQAFYALRDGLYDGREITQAISGSYEVLTGAGR